MRAPPALPERCEGATSTQGWQAKCFVATFWGDDQNSPDFWQFRPVCRRIFWSRAPMTMRPRTARGRIVPWDVCDFGGPGPRGCCVLPAKTRSFSRPFWPPIERGEASAARSAAKMASKMGAFLPAHHNNRGDPDHQNRTRPGTRYGLALCAGASPSVRANIK